MSAARTNSFEFFPPKTDEGVLRLRDTWRELGALEPQFFSVTFGAGGSTREGTLATVQAIHADGKIAAPHISCIGTTRAEVRALIDEYRQMGIRRLVALRGDLPSGAGPTSPGDFRYANELVEFVRQMSADWFHIEVAAYPEFHPQSRSAREDVGAFARKMKSGADSAITQFFYNAEAYFRFIDEIRAMGINAPVVPGVMPITNFMQLKGFAERCAIDIPRWLAQRMAGFGDDVASIRAYGLDVVTELCARLLSQGAPGLHFYTLNRSQACAEIWRRLKL